MTSIIEFNPKARFFGRIVDMTCTSDADPGHYRGRVHAAGTRRSVARRLLPCCSTNSMSGRWMAISALALARDAQQGLRPRSEDRGDVGHAGWRSACATLLGDAPVIKSEGPDAYPGGDALSRPRPTRPDRLRPMADASATLRAAREAIAARSWCSCRAQAEIRRAEPRNLKSASADPNSRRYRGRSMGALPLRASRTAIAIEPSPAGTTQGGAGDLDRGNLAHHRRRARRDRQRSVACAVLRAGCGPDKGWKPCGCHSPRRSAPRPHQPHRPGVCYRLWDEPQTGSLEPYTAAGDFVGRLSGFVLDLAQWGASVPGTLAFLDLPPAGRAQ